MFNFIKKLSVISVFSNSRKKCEYCGKKFNFTKNNGLCPYCQGQSEYSLEQLHSNIYNIEKARRQKARLKKAIFRFSVLLLIAACIIASVTLVISNAVKNRESLIYKTFNRENQPVFFTTNQDEIYFVDNKKSAIFIGTGTVSAFASSADGKNVFLTINGNTDSDSISQNKCILLNIKDFKDVSTVAESSYGTIDFISGGNCNYLYYQINETLSNYDSSSRLYLYKSSARQSYKLSESSDSENHTNFRVSDNGRYLLYKSGDNDGTKIMKFSVKTMESESVGVKNAEPLTIDNMGKYISYIKKNESGNLDVYIESNVQDREKVALETPLINSVLVSSDYRSFVFECGNISTFKTVGSDPFTILAKTGSGLEIKIDEYSSYNVFENKDVSFVEKVCYCENRSFLPYYYIDSTDGQNQVMVADKTGNKTPLFDKTFSEYKSSGKNIAFISNGSLYTAQINNKDASTSLVSENFSGYSLTDISNNGKYIFFSDEDGNMYRMPYKYDGSNMTKIAVDAVFLEPSDNGKTALFVSNSALSILNKNLKIKKVSEKVDEKSVYFLEKFSKLLYIENENDSKSLYLYKNNKQNLLSSNIKQVIFYPFLNLGYGNIAGDSDISDN